MSIPEEFTKFKEKITDFFQKNNIQTSSLSVVEGERSRNTELTTKLNTIQEELSDKDKLIEELQSNLSESISLAEQLQSQLELLSANKSVPANLADPKLNINKSIDEDTAGKQLLKEIPYQERIKLKNNI